MSALSALEVANERRARFYTVRRELAALDATSARERAAELICDPPAGLGTMRVEWLLRACPGVGRLTVARLMTAAVLPGGVQLGELKVRERLDVAHLLRLVSSYAKAAV